MLHALSYSILFYSVLRVLSYLILFNFCHIRGGRQPTSHTPDPQLSSENGLGCLPPLVLHAWIYSILFFSIWSLHVLSSLIISIFVNIYLDMDEVKCFREEIIQTKGKYLDFIKLRLYSTVYSLHNIKSLSFSLSVQLRQLANLQW